MNFEKLTSLLDGIDSEYGIPACECIVYVDHKEVYRHHKGYRDANRTAPLLGGEWYWLYSASKVMTMVAAMQLVENGRLELDAPVSSYIPCFGDVTVKSQDGETHKANKTMTVRHLMTMAGGYTYNWQTENLLAAMSDGKASTKEIVSAIAREPLIFEPGEHFRYSMCHDVLAAVVEVISGEGFSDYIKHNITELLGIKGLTYHPTLEHYNNMPDKFVYNDNEKKVMLGVKENPLMFTENYDSGGAGICCRAEDYIVFLDALACGGVGKNGVRIIKPESIEMLRTNQLNEIQLADYHRTMKPDPNDGYGLGVRVRLSDDGKLPKGEFGWDGAAGANAVVYPEKKVSICYVQHVENYLRVWRELLPNISKEVYAAMNNAK